MRIRNAGPSPDERKGAASQAMKTGSGSPPALKPLTVSVKTAQQIIGVGNTTMYELIGDGRVESIKMGNKRLILFASLERLVTPSNSSQTSDNPAARATAARLASAPKRWQRVGRHREYRSRKHCGLHELGFECRSNISERIVS
jgi:excisionase family DNA binding protein